ncbi:type VII secretion integral membrane protein EccD [Micromonospora olivasterospora]|uniref:Type VII secretion integral membrane protein EccD n=1 Tax=Micromonospora olivasterospora TaxID=1880 RepID=A0A562IJ54_MICOL|nr:type VII secretion integral membrane protein EccD [Micromonospora olivasterospora]TWH70654.1 type VII secretion integral membrane protein EccD [Micromonospora olivasterospora]
MSAERGELCRLLVVGPTSQVDVSLPTHIPLADMMPALLSALGPDLADRGLEHSGWIVQRLGGPALDESSTVGDLDLVDGEVVHVRPRTDQIPPLAYDDLVDGVSAGLRKRSGLWRPQTTRVTALLLFAAWLAAWLAAARMWPGAPRGPVLLAVMAAMCFVAGFAVVRKLADRATAGILGAACVAGTVLAALGAVAPHSPLADASVPRLIFVGASAGTVAALLVAAFVFPRTGWRQITVGLLAAWLLIVAALLLRTRATLDWTTIAAIMLVATTALRPAVPAAAFKLAGLALPETPAEPADLQENIDPEPAAEVLTRAAAADQFMTALYAALGLVSGAAMVWLAAAPGWAAPLAAWLAAAAQILVTRPMTSTWHRLALAGPALAAVATWCLTAITDRGQLAAELAIGCCLIMVAACGLAARIPVGRRFNPIWGRLGDLAHTAAVAALAPTVVVITGLIDVIRARVG